MSKKGLDDKMTVDSTPIKQGMKGENMFPVEQMKAWHLCSRDMI